MDIDVIREALDPRSFRPFEIVLVNGATFAVPYPDSLYVPVNRKTKRPPRYVHLHNEEDSTGRTIDSAMIAQIVRHENGANGPNGSNGSRGV